MSTSAQGSGYPPANHLTWVMPRSSRAFLVRVVEPAEYNPGFHGTIFQQTMTALIMSEANGVGDGRSLGLAPFDLVTFPEAFAPADDLMAVLTATDAVEALGCVHVGLRPSPASDHHLFSTADVHDLVNRVSALPRIHAADLGPFRVWLDRQAPYHRFNIGCLFAIDSDSRLRVCLHPKQVKARNEHSALPEEMMKEAELLSLVTLVPSDRRFLTITIQPLICADALNLQTEHGNPSPIALVSSGHTSLDNPPDHVDIVSLATCTPQVIRHSDAQAPAWEWHQDFRSAFPRTQEGDWPRHRYATFAISNFEQIRKRRGGLSGLFQPIALKDAFLHDNMSLSCYGEPSHGGNNVWSTPGDYDGWRWRGFLGMLAPAGVDDGAAVRILAFKLSSSLRDAPPWKGPLGPGACEVKLGRWEGASDLKFVDWSERYDR